MNLHKLLVILVIFSVTVASCQKEDMPQLDYRKLGASANDILSDRTYGSIDIGISHTPGLRLPDSVLNHIANYLNTVANKPGGIRFTQTSFSRPVVSPMTLDQVVTLEKQVRTGFTQGSVLRIHIMVVDAEYQTPDILGISYWNTSMCVFGKAIDRFSGRPGLLSRNQLLITLIEHEMGHLLGLVDQGTPMVIPHKSNNGAHCTSSSCLMYYIIETSGNPSTPTPVLDANCRNDLRANGGK
jgi:hypothetical protein